VWDLKSYKNRLYIGSGDSVKNAGPIDIWSYNPTSEKFENEFTVPDEEIRSFKVLNGALVVPGIDPKGPWDLGNFYQLKDGVWKTIRNIFNGIHNLDMTIFGGILYAGLGTAYGAVVVVSEDHGKSWGTHHVRPSHRGFARARSFFELENELYVSTTGRSGSQIYRLVGETFLKDTRGFFPGGRRHDALIVTKFTKHRDRSIYIGAAVWARDPKDIFVARSSNDIVKIDLPERMVPRDILSFNGKIFVLTHKFDRGDFISSVSELVRSANLKPLFHFRKKSFARSFEKIGEYFYFGLGSF